MVNLLDSMLCMLNICLTAERPILMSVSSEQTAPEGAKRLGVVHEGGPFVVLRIRSRGEVRWTGYWVRE